MNIYKFRSTTLQEWQAGTSSDTSYLMVRANECNDLVKEIYRSIDRATNRMKGMGETVDYALREEVHDLTQLLSTLYANKKQVRSVQMSHFMVGRCWELIV